QPLKLAALEAHFETEKGVRLWIGGIPDAEKETVSFGIKIPYALSFLAFNDPHAEVKGLKEFPKDEWPPLLPTHIAFQVMEAIGTYAALLAVTILLLGWRKKDFLEHPLLLKLLVIGTPLGFLGVEAGWIVTEVGRQPWIIYGIMKTKDAVSPMPGIEYVLYFFTGVYFFLAGMVCWLMWRQFKLFQIKES